MPDKFPLTKAEKSSVEIYRETMLWLQNNPHTVFSNRYYCLSIGYVWRGINEYRCRYCNTPLSENPVAEAASSPENQS